jgi:hypothetical protein
MIRSLSALFAVLALAGLMSACGDDDEEAVASDAAVAAFELSGSGQEARMSGPGSLEAGAVQVDFKNSTKDDAGVTLVRVEGGHTAAQAVKAGRAWGEGNTPLPDWVRFVGGVASIRSGETSTSVQSLPQGNYAAVDINTSAFAPFEVTGNGDGELPTSSARVEARDYSFEASGLEAGKGRVLFTNTGKEPHFALMAPIKPGKTLDDVRKALETEEGETPIFEAKTVSTGVLDGGESQVVDLALLKGKYALVCFVAERKGGPPHAFKGMVSGAVVE